MQLRLCMRLAVPRVLLPRTLPAFTRALPVLCAVCIADHFDVHLTEKLQYRTPSMLM